MILAGGLVPGIQQVAIGIIEIAIGLDGVAGIGAGLYRGVAHILGGVFLGDIAVFLGIGDLIGHFHILAGDICTVKADMDIIVLYPGIHPDGIIGIVAEFEVDIAPIHRGITAHGYIGHQELMGLPLHYLQIGLQSRQIDGRSHLAHAAAQLLDGLAADIDTGLKIALGLSSLAHQAVIAEHIAGLQNGAIDGLTGLGNVDIAVIVGAGQLAVHRSQQVREELAGKGV